MVLRISPILVISLASVIGNSFFMVAALTPNDFLQRLGFIVHDNHGSFSEALANSLPVFNIEHIPSMLKAGDAEKGKSLKIDPGFISSDNTCEMCVRVEYSPGAVHRAGFAYKFDKPLDLSGAGRLVFFAKGEKGGETLAIVAIGKNIPRSVQSDGIRTPPMTAPLPEERLFKNQKFEVMTRNVTLSNDWSRYQISLNGTNLKNVISPFGVILQEERMAIVDLIKNKKSVLPRPPSEFTKGKVVFYLKGVTIDDNPATQSLSLRNSMLPLTVNLTANNTASNVNQTTQFKATVVGGMAPYMLKWNFGDKNESSGELSMIHRFSKPGSYNVRVKVNDSSLPPNTTQGNTTVTIIPGNQTSGNQTSQTSGNQTSGNQTSGNQTSGNQTSGNQTGQTSGNQTGQTSGNQTGQTSGNQTGQTSGNQTGQKPKSPNNNPVATDKHEIVQSNGLAELKLLATDVDNDHLIYTIVSQPSHGVLGGLDKNTGAVSYIPQPSFAGADRFSFKVVDSDGAESNTAKITLTVFRTGSSNETFQKLPRDNRTQNPTEHSSQQSEEKISRGNNNNVPQKGDLSDNNVRSGNNLPPTTYDQTIETEQNKKIKISLKATANNEDKIVFSISKYPSHGKLLSLDPDNGKVVYVPNPQFAGYDGFTFKASGQGANASNESQVLIKVNGINDVQILSNGNPHKQPIERTNGTGS